MAGESDDLDKLFESVADGESVDWDKLEREAPDEESRVLIRQLRLIAEVAEVHRSQVDEVVLAEDVAPLGPGAGGGTVPIQSAAGRRLWADLATTTAGATGATGGVSSPGTPPSSHLGVWGHLLLIQKIGEGSFGEVFHAHDTWLDHPVALKLLKPEAESRVPPAQLLHEARKLARVRHANVVTVHGADRHNGRVGFWMDFVEGETLATRVAKGRLSPGEAISIGQEVCRALAAVHQVKLIHRDVKAQNVMRAHDGGRIILMDFGAGEFMGASLGTRAQGTPLYLAPELLEGGAANSRTDIYAVGVLLYHLVTGGFPVEGASPAALLEAHRQGQRRRLRDERPDLPDSFIAIVERAIDPDPIRRYASAGEMEAKLAGEPITRPEPVTVAPTRRLRAWDYAKRAAGVVVALVVLTVLFGFLAARGFDIFLRVEPDFALGVAGVLFVGVQAMIPFVIYGAFGVAVLFGLTLLQVMIRPLGRLWNRLVTFANAWDPVMTASAIALAGAASWVVLNRVVFADFFGALYTVMDDPATRQDLSILGSAPRSLHLNHFYFSTYISMALGLAVWRWFPALERRTTSLSTVKLLKWCVVAIALVFMSWAVLPRRIIWERFPIVQFESRTAFVIGTAGDELLVYEPDQPGRPRRRIRQDIAGFRRTGETGFLFDRERER
jgi:tRNA A-37 threonylcarbamoyl transferase component Bud32